MLRAVRICKPKYAATAFDGIGAARYPGRWNQLGERMVYTSDSPALAFLEILVHVDRPLMKHYAFFPLSFEEELVETLDPSTLPPDWKSLLDPGWAPLQALGSAWLASLRSAVLRVPTVIVPNQVNYLLNPAHPDFSKIKIGPLEDFSPDTRLA